MPRYLPSRFQFPAPAQFADGTAAAPSRTYVDDADLGSYRVGANNEGFTAGGALVWDYNASRLNLASAYGLAWAGDTFLARTAANAVKLYDGATTLGNFAALKFSTTGTFTFAQGMTVGTGGYFGMTGGPYLTVGAHAASGEMAFASLAANSDTSGANALFGAVTTFNPGSGSGSYALVHLNPTINGTSSGTAYGFGVASKTNTLTGGTIVLASVGTTTTDLFTGYMPVWDVRLTGMTLGGTRTITPVGMTAAASANLKVSNNTEKSTVALTYTKIKEIRLNEALAGVRIKFDLKTAGGGATATGRIYKSGVAVGTEQTDVTGGYVTKSEDLTGFVIGDLLQIYAKTSDAAQAAYVQNFQLFYDLTADTTTALSATAQDP